MRSLLARGNGIRTNLGDFYVKISEELAEFETVRTISVREKRSSQV
jgi:hypothetical protein